KRKIQILGILLFAFALMYFISLVGHSVSDDLRITSDEAVYGNPFTLGYVNPGGMMGAYLSFVTLFFLGWSAFFMAPFLAVLALKITGLDIARRLFKHAAMAWGLAFQILLVSDVSKTATTRLEIVNVPDGVGALGHTIIELSIKLIGLPGAYILFLATIASTLFLYTSISHRFRHAASAAGNILLLMLRDAYNRLLPQMKKAVDQLILKNRAVIRRPEFRKELKRAMRGGRKNDEMSADSAGEEAGTEIKDKIITSASGTVESKRKVVMPRGAETHAGDSADGQDSETPTEYVRPTADLLSEGDRVNSAYDERELADTARSLRETLETFGVKLSGNIEMFPGPVITRFEIRPAAGIKVNQIANLSEDLALNLRAKSIRIVAPIPGKAAVGIEIPNRNPQTVYLRDVIASDEFRNNRLHLPLILGKDISGKPYMADLATMPHLLIAGTTGSGKSVCINVIITSLLFSLHPHRLRFIFIDPKMLELTVYKGIPFLGENVVTNPKQAERVLTDAVTEMEKRYRLLAAASVRSINDYNTKQKTEDSVLPYIVVVVDELADLMMSTQSSRVELLITRLAQMARAVGIHLILATQRPSVDVITGLIKANFPSRIAFQVATKTDSRTILDGNGAERLLGNGDMLYLESGSPAPVRLHGAFISSEDTEKLVSFIKSQTYSKAREEEAKVEAEEKAQLRQYNDPVLLEAIETVIQQGQASVSLLQRKLGIGYQRAARIIDDL
ncbi:MAG: DNA translocase FtsK 4TM domain-containing protein, partial [Planctomycetes bacterium]|nr:DNA translocase FtsK 4TM domain-containing protein [Planctomycetota bacterium]